MQTAVAELDVRIENHRSLFIVQPLTANAQRWIEDHCGPADELQWWGGGLVVEPRYIQDLTEGMISDGLEVQ